jgi:thioredoxin-dependent peroxiredoxin
MSADSVKALAIFKQKHKFNFPLLSDSNHKTIEAFGAWQEKLFMGRRFMGIVRSSFLIGKTGKIETVWPLVRAKGHAAEVLKHIQND